MSKSTVLITGGAQGLGRAFAEYFLQRAYQVAVFDRDAQALEALGQAHPELHCYCVDLTDATQVQKSVDLLSPVFAKRLDVLINNAGLISSVPMVNLFNTQDPYHNIEQFEKIIQTNLNSAFYTTRFCLPLMIEHRQGGLIINMSSIAAQGNLGQSAYSAAKAGLDTLTRVWSQELAHFKIRTVSIAPGFVDSESLQHTLTASKRDDWQHKIPLQRFAEVNEIIQSVQFAIDNAYVNGTILEINGGLRLS